MDRGLPGGHGVYVMSDASPRGSQSKTRWSCKSPIGITSGGTIIRMAAIAGAARRLRPAMPTSTNPSAMKKNAEEWVGHTRCIVDGGEHEPDVHAEQRDGYPRCCLAGSTRGDLT
jgi:hypothetical protein